MTTDLTVVKQQESAVAVLNAGIFKDFDFQGLNRIIDVIGDKSAELTPDEKEAATGIVGEWQTNVIQRLDKHSTKMYCLMRMLHINSDKGFWFAPSPGSDYMSKEQINQLVLATDTQALFDAAAFAYETQMEYSRDNHPDKPYTDDNMSYNEIARLNKLYEADVSRYNIEHTKLCRKTHLAFQTFIKTVVKHKTVKEMLRKAEAYTASVKSYKSECQNKATMAKLNIQISSPEIRAMIHEMLNFASTI